MSFRTSEPLEIPLPRALTWRSLRYVAVRSYSARLMTFMARAALPLLLAVVTFVVFSPALRNDFVNWDDHILIKGNLEYRGLGWTQIRWMFSTVLMGHWVPLTWLTLGLDYMLWGMKPLGYHLTNILLHSANAALFYLVGRRLLEKAATWSGPELRIAAVVAALFFSLHPLRAEPVAWVTERRDVLSGLFFLLAVLGYLKALDETGRRRWWRLAGSVGCYALAFTAKSMVMTLPMILVLLDVYPLRRLDVRWRAWRSGEARRVLVEKVPYFVIGAAGAIVAYYAQAANFFLTSLTKVPLANRPALAFYGLWFYVSKTAVPAGLSPLYQMPLQLHPLAPRFLVPAIAVVLITLTLLALGRRWPAGLAAWLYYAIVITPVVGIVHSGHQLAHDRYSYLSCMSWPLLVGAASGLVVRAWQGGVIRPSLARLAVGTMMAWLAGLGLLSWYQVQIWRDTETLWRFAIESEPECRLCQNNLGVMLLSSGVPGQARDHLERAVALDPGALDPQKALALAHGFMGDLPRALEGFTKVVPRDPTDSVVRNNFGVALCGLRRYREALEQFQYALRLKPNDALVLANLATTYAELGDRELSVKHIRRAVEVKPDAPGPHYTFGLVSLQFGDLETAREEYEILRKLDARMASFLGPCLIMEW